jgi:hypothetical protein
MALDYEITAVRLEPSRDRSHMHLELIGYTSPHMPGEEITIDISRALQKMDFDEKFHIVLDGERAEIVEGTCPSCDLKPYLRTSADAGDEQKLFALPRE